MTEWAPDRGVTASPFPPIAEYGVPVRLRDLRAGRAERQRRVAVPAALRLAERVRGDPRPRRRRLPARPGRRRGAGRAPLPARHERPRDELGHDRRLDHRARRAPDRALAPRARPLAHAPPRADRLRRRPRAAADGPLRERRDPGDDGLRAALRLRGLRAQDGRVGVRGRGLPRGGLPRRGLRRRAAADHRHEHGLRGPARHRAHAHEGGRHAVRGAVLVRAPARRRPTTRRTTGSSGRRTTGSTGSTTASSPTTPGAPTSSARADAEGAVVRAHRARWWRPRPPRCRRRPGGERNWDYRYSWIRDSTFMLWGLYTLGFDWEANDFFYFIADIAEQEDGRPPDHVRDRRRGRDPGVHARPPLGLRGRAAGARRQRRLQPGAARRLGRAARLDLPAHEVARPPATSGSGRSSKHQVETALDEVARAGPRHLGDPRRAEALHLVEDDVLGGRRPRRAARRDPRRARVRGALAVGRRRDQGGHPRARRGRARRVHPALRHGRARRLGAADGAHALPAGRRRAHRARPCSRSRTS